LSTQFGKRKKGDFEGGGGICRGKKFFDIRRRKKGRNYTLGFSFWAMNQRRGEGKMYRGEERGLILIEGGMGTIGLRRSKGVAKKKHPLEKEYQGSEIRPTASDEKR